MGLSIDVSETTLGDDGSLTVPRPTAPSANSSAMPSRGVSPTLGSACPTPGSACPTPNPDGATPVSWKKHIWKADEDATLERQVAMMTAEGGKVRWSAVGAQMSGRSGKQCRERWHNHLSPEVNKSEPVVTKVPAKPTAVGAMRLFGAGDGSCIGRRVSYRATERTPQSLLLSNFHAARAAPLGRREPP